MKKRQKKEREYVAFVGHDGKCEWIEEIVETRIAPSYVVKSKRKLPVLTFGNEAYGIAGKRKRGRRG